MNNRNGLFILAGDLFPLPILQDYFIYRLKEKFNPNEKNLYTQVNQEFLQLLLNKGYINTKIYDNIHSYYSTEKGNNTELISVERGLFDISEDEVSEKSGDTKERELLSEEKNCISYNCDYSPVEVGSQNSLNYSGDKDFTESSEEDDPSDPEDNEFDYKNINYEGIDYYFHTKEYHVINNHDYGVVGEWSEKEERILFSERRYQRKHVEMVLGV